MVNEIPDPPKIGDIIKLGHGTEGKVTAISMNEKGYVVTIRTGKWEYQLQWPCKPLPPVV